MCQLCDFKRDMYVMQSVMSLLLTVDFENFLALADLVENMVYTIETDGNFEEVTKILEAPENCDIPFVEAMRAFVPVVETLQSSVHQTESAAEEWYAALREGLDSIGSSEEDEYSDPPTAFTDFFKGGDEDE